jgi:hypothetical protein
MEAINQSERRWQAETSVELQRSASRYIPEHRTIHTYSCEDIKSHPDYTAKVGKLHSDFVFHS